MHYRPLGRTGLRVSEIGLGGHWPDPAGNRYASVYEGDRVPREVVKHRVAVLDACLELGINYIDITTAAECAAYGAALAGRRERFFIGADDYRLGCRRPERLNTAVLVEAVEGCLRRLRMDRLDLWRVTTDVNGGNTPEHLACVAEAARRLRQAGKIRFLGLSSHHRPWLRAALQSLDGLDVVIMPCLPASRPAPPAESALLAARDRGLGVIAIKPFAGGSLFAGRALSRGQSARLAGAALRRVLALDPAISCVVAGFCDAEELRATVLAAAQPGDDDGEAGPTADGLVAGLQSDRAWLTGWLEV